MNQSLVTYGIVLVIIIMVLMFGSYVSKNVAATIENERQAAAAILSEE